MSLSYRWTMLFGGPRPLLSPTSAAHALCRLPAPARYVVTPHVSTPLAGFWSRTPHGPGNAPSKSSDHTITAPCGWVPTSADPALREPANARDAVGPHAIGRAPA